MRVVVLLWTLLLSYAFGAYAQSTIENDVLTAGHFFKTPTFPEDVLLLEYDGKRRTSHRWVDAELEVVRQYSSPDGNYIGLDETLTLTIKIEKESKIISVFVRHRHFGGLDIFATEDGQKIGRGFCGGVRCELDFTHQEEWIIMGMDIHRDGWSEVDRSKQRINLSIAREDGEHFTWFGKPMKLVVFAATLQRG